MVQLLGYGPYIPSKIYMPYFSGQREHQMRASLLGVWNNECQKCYTGVDFYDADLHHLNPKEKRFTLDQGTIGSILKVEGVVKGTQKILTEAAKCALVCRQCHVDMHKTGRLNLEG